MSSAGGYPAPMSEKLRRAVRLLQHLQRRSRITNREVRELNHCDEQTARRDLLSLVDAGVPLERRGAGAETYYVVSREWKRNGGFQFSMGDAMALHMGRQLMAFLEGTTLPEWMDGLREKLGIGADDKTLEKESRLARKLIYLSEPSRRYAAHDDTMNTLLTAVVDERCVEADYTTRRGPRHYQLQPLALVIYRRALYLLAYEGEPRRVLRLPVERFRQATLGERFRWPRGLDVQALLGESFGIYDAGQPSDVRLRFAPEVSDLVRARHWHPTERFEARDDGSLDLVMHTGGPELARLVLEWGDRVEVIAPATLRQEVARQLRDALSHYA